MYVDEYDDGAFKRFVIEATASYHLRFIFLSSLLVRMFACVFPATLSALQSAFFQNHKQCHGDGMYGADSILNYSSQFKPRKCRAIFNH